MTPLAAIASSLKGKCADVTAAHQPSVADLLIQLEAVAVVGRQMFERDCLSFCFDTWARAEMGGRLPEMERVSASDVLSDIADIRALPVTHPEEIAEVDHDLLQAVAAIESYVRAHAPTLQ